MNVVTLLTDLVKDAVARENFVKLQRFINDEEILKSGFTFYEIIFTQAETNKRIPHRLGFLPKDVIQTSVLGNQVVIWNYDLFDATYLDVTTSGACTVRAFIGSHG